MMIDDNIEELAADRESIVAACQTTIGNNFESFEFAENLNKNSTQLELDWYTGIANGQCRTGKISLFIGCQFECHCQEF
jgi:hypothetical protein